MKSRIIFHKSVFPVIPCRNGMAVPPQDAGTPPRPGILKLPPG